MKKVVAVIFLISIQVAAFGQSEPLRDFTTLVKDLDNDGIRDTVYLSFEDSTIVCRLSTQNFAKIVSKPINFMKMSTGVRETEDGFVFYDYWMRAGYENHFGYNSKTKKIQLIGMSDYAYGNVVHDGSGESSVNLLTGDYIENRNYYDSENDSLIGSTSKSKMYFETINLENFSDNPYNIDYYYLQDTIPENVFFGDICQMDLEHVDTINLQFAPISEGQFLNFRTLQPASNYNFILPTDHIPFYIATKNKGYKFRGTPSDKYRYLGYVPEINSHIISACNKRVCFHYLLDNRTDEKVMLPCYFDSGVLGLKISASQKRMLIYDAANYADYYPHRAEIIFMKIGEEFQELINFKICIITEWSIEDIVWIDDNSIALKVYDKHEEGNSIHEPVYQYFKAELK